MPTQFTPTEWATAKKKLKFAKHFFKFVKEGFKKTPFKEWFYKELSRMFGHIAHCDLNGFYKAWFATTANQIRFLEHTLRPPSGFNGDPHYTWVDVETAIANDPCIEETLLKLRKRLGREIETRERAQLASLQAKYPDA